MALKPTHLTALTEILISDGYESPADMAKALVARLDELRSDDVEWAIVTEYGNTPMFMGVRGFATRNQAIKFFEQGKVGVPGLGRKAIVPFYHRHHVEATRAAADDFEERHKAHWTRIIERVSG